MELHSAGAQMCRTTGSREACTYSLSLLHVLEKCCTKPTSISRGRHRTLNTGHYHACQGCTCLTTIFKVSCLEPLVLPLQVATQVVASLLALESIDPEEDITIYINSQGELPVWLQGTTQKLRGMSSKMFKERDNWVQQVSESAPLR